MPGFVNHYSVRRKISTPLQLSVPTKISSASFLHLIDSYFSTSWIFWLFLPLKLNKI